jgi:two-component system, chemotaxis family, chemotaxis protein CheY
MKVLLADDDPFILVIFTRYLEEAGHKVIAVNNGWQALKKLETEKQIDIIISDVFMPEVSGIMMGNLIKQFYFSRIPLLLMSTNNSAAVRRAAALAGAEGFIVKPATKNILLQAIADVQNTGSRQGSN